jgi:hypothetical protein
MESGGRQAATRGWQPEAFGNVKRIPQLLAAVGVVDQVAIQVAKSARKLGPDTARLQ